MAPTATQISQWLRDNRERLKLARRAASVALDVTEKTIERWEDPDHPALPPADQFLALVVLYKADIQQFLAKRVTRERGGQAESELERKRRTG